MELKYSICKIPTYDEAEQIKRKERSFDEIYEVYYPNLPEEEQLAIDVLQTSLDVHMSQNITFGQGIIDDYLLQIKLKEEYSINDLLIIELYFGCIYYQGYEKEIFNKILYRVIEQANFIIDTDLFYIRKVLFAAASITLVQNEYHELKKVIQVLKLIMKHTQDFQQKPILSMIEGKYYLFAENNSELAKEKYDDALVCAGIFENDLLVRRIEAEWQSDYQQFRAE
nr:Cro/Cl family transcriptional regulator [Vagococcus allomyrinae]